MSPRVSVFWFLLSSVVGVAGGQTPANCDSAEQRAFDFWVGDWEVRTTEGQLAGTNRIESQINGCALVEHWSGAGGSVGMSINAYDRVGGKWHQNWVDGQGGRLVLEGGLVDDTMAMSGNMRGPDGQYARHEISWQPLEDGSVRQHWRVSQDDGATWQDLFVGIYRKKVADAAVTTTK